MNQRRIVVAAVLTGALYLPVWAQEKPGEIVGTSEPGKVVLARNSKVTATVEAVDVEKRELRLKGPRGNVLPLTVGMKVQNLDKIKVGDRIAVEYLEALIISLKKDGEQVPASELAAGAARSAPGDLPAGIAARQREVTGKVITVDRKKQTVTVRGPKRSIDLQVPDPDQLERIKAGDRVQAVYTEALALALAPAAGKHKK